MTVIFLKSWQPISIAYSKNSNGSFDYSKYMMIILVEICKLLISIIGLIFHLEPKEERNIKALSGWHLMYLFGSSILYAFSNLIVFTSITYINPALYHVFGNLRILVTAVLYKMIFNKKQTDI